MIPDRGYRITTRRLFVACWVMAFGLAGLGGLLLDRWTGAGTILLIMAIGCLRLAREVRDEMNRWIPPAWQFEAWRHYTNDGIVDRVEVLADGTFRFYRSDDL